MKNELRSPIILFGNTRSGTTIVQKVLNAHPDVAGWYEPGAVWRYADPGRTHDEFNEQDATEEVKRYIWKQFLIYQKQHENQRVLEKTPQNVLRIPYVRAIFPDAAFLYIVRNPFSFISSVEYKWQKPVTRKGIFRRLKSTPLHQLHHYIRHFLSQQYDKRILGKKYLSIWGPRYKGIFEDLKTQSLLTVIARQWSIPSKKAEDDFAFFGRNEVLKLRYEDFVENPIDELKRINAHCGLEMTESLVHAAKTMVKSDRQNKWRRFDPGELAQILPEIEHEMRRHGYQIPAEIANAYNDLVAVEG